ncbi:hypothetical protein J2Z65_002724 [Paenibacillus aceris]|uniref:Uncharacterized protein n=1 Tax=Paenibacillus aceris TaxID=869555 RepID=A0ABS4HXY7_9BACL|nr:hypothetical protein [Paenibacillus aceris]
MHRLIVFSLLLVLLTSCSDTLDKEIVDSAPTKRAGTERTVLIDKSSNKNENNDVNLGNKIELLYSCGINVLTL